MVKMTKEEDKTFSEEKAESINELDVKEKSEQLRKETLEEIEERAESTTKTGRKSKDAKQAENELVLVGGIETILMGINTVISSKFKELKHEEEEIRTIATLSAPVLAKHVDLDALEYKEEVKLVSYLLMCEMEKMKRLTKRLKAERQQEEKKENSKPKKEDSKDASGKSKG